MLRVMNALTNAKNFALLLFVIANTYSTPPDSVPIAEYCVVYEKKKSCDCETDFSNLYLRLEKILERHDDIVICTTEEYNFHWMRKFLIHDDLKAELGGTGINVGYPGTLHVIEYNNSTKVELKYSSTIVEWSFASEVPVYAKDTNWVDSAKYGKYYKKGKIIPVEWQLKAKCDSFYESTYSGSYFIRITGECKE